MFFFTAFNLYTHIQMVVNEKLTQCIWLNVRRRRFINNQNVPALRGKTLILAQLPTLGFILNNRIKILWIKVYP